MSATATAPAPDVLATRMLTVASELFRLAGELHPPSAVVAESARADAATEFRRVGAIWNVRWRGVSAVVPDSKGMRDLAALLASPGNEIHVLDLVEAAGGPAAKVAGGDVGPVLDARARAAYSARVVELDDEIAAAESARDNGRLETLARERDFLVAELRGALGLGGRPRRAGDRVERARKAVTQRIATAVRSVEQAHPGLARHLRASVTTGRFCSYQPEEPMTWRT